MHVRWTQEALADREDIARHIEENSAAAAQRVAAEIVNSAEELSAFLTETV